MEYLYTFHVAGFFILPFFYQNNDHVSWDKIGKIVVRSWIPYLWVCLLCWTVFSLYQHHFEFGWGHVFAFANGTQSPIRQYFGFVFPWFLPTYCSMSLLLMFARRWRWIGLLGFTLGLGTFLMSWEQFYQFKNTISLGLGLALHFFTSGVIAFYSNKLSVICKYIGGILFVALSICWWCAVPIGILFQLMPASFFLFLLCLVPYINFPFLQFVGRYSLGIYLFHVFIINILERILPHETAWGWVVFAISLLGALMITYIIYQNKKVRTVLFPKSWDELRSIFK